MLRREFDIQFDVLFNSLTSNQAPGFNAYEKSVVLTKAQDEVLKNYFNPKGNKYQEGYDDSPKRQIDFSRLTKNYTLASENLDTAKFDSRDNSKSVVLPSDIMMIINERVKVTRCNDILNLVVVPIAYDEYDRLMSKPYKRPLKNQAWRLINSGTGENTADLIVHPQDTISGYSLRYVRKPLPIIVGDIGNLTINGYTANTVEEGQTPPSNWISGECELDPILHEEILQRAVEIAKAIWTSTGQDNINAIIQSGQRSE